MRGRRPQFKPHAKIQMAQVLGSPLYTRSPTTDQHYPLCVGHLCPIVRCLNLYWFSMGGTQIIFWPGVQLEVWNPNPYLWIVSLKKWLIWLFFQNFCKFGPILKRFCTSKMVNFTRFLQFLWNGTLFKGFFFLTKIEPMSKDFWWESNPFRWFIPVCFNMWEPSPGSLKASKQVVSNKRIRDGIFLFCSSLMVS